MYKTYDSYSITMSLVVDICVWLHWSVAEFSSNLTILTRENQHDRCSHQMLSKQNLWNFSGKGVNISKSMAHESWMESWTRKWNSDLNPLLEDVILMKTVKNYIRWILHIKDEDIISRARNIILSTISERNKHWTVANKCIEETHSHTCGLNNLQSILPGTIDITLI